MPRYTVCAAGEFAACQIALRSGVIEAPLRNGSNRTRGKRTTWEHKAAARARVYASPRPPECWVYASPTGRSCSGGPTTRFRPDPFAS
jgi:hypothetical protein